MLGCAAVQSTQNAKSTLSTSAYQLWLLYNLRLTLQCDVQGHARARREALACASHVYSSVCSDAGLVAVAESAGDTLAQYCTRFPARQVPLQEWVCLERHFTTAASASLS